MLNLEQIDLIQAIFFTLPLILLSPNLVQLSCLNFP